MKNPEQSCNAILLEFFQQCAQELSGQATLAKISLTRKNIHNLRLSLKSLKAFCSLLDAVQARKPAVESFPVSFSKLFEELGNLRDCQVASKTLLEISSELKLSVKRIDLNLKKMSKINLLQVSTLLNQFDPDPELHKIGEKVKRVLDKQPDPNSLKPVFIRYHHELGNIIHSLILLRHSERIVHTLRGYIKMLFYTVGIFQRETWFSAELGHIRSEMLNQVQLELGLWHDLVVLKSLILDVGRMKGKDRVKPWKIYLLEEYIKKKLALKLKEINQILLPPMLAISTGQKIK